MSKMKIAIWSDIACPYCYIGKRKLEKALTQFPHKDNIELEWHSYELDPELPKKASNQTIYAHFAEKYGMQESDARASQAKIAEQAKTVGLNYDFDKLIVANTNDALRLVKLANKSGLATEAEEVLFDAYFVKGLDVSAHDVLVNMGTKIGLKKNDILALFVEKDYIEDIKKDIEFSENEYDLQYIPFYIFNNKHIVQGSIEVEDYLEVLEKSYAEWEHNGVSTEKGDTISGHSCSIDGVCSL